MQERQGNIDRRGEYADERDLEAFWAEAAPRREPMQQRWFLPAILVLLALSVPWYWPSGTVGPIVAGLPLWVWVALLCSAGVAAVTAWVAMRHWDDDEEIEAEAATKIEPARGED